MSPARRFRRLGAAFAIVIVMAGVSAAAAAQRGFFRSRQREIDIRNAPYNGQFTFVRVNYTTAPGGYWYQGLPAWSHGFPLAERNLMRILNEITALDPRIDEINSVKLDDPELFKYPVAYIIEVGWWEMTDKEAAASATTWPKAASSSWTISRREGLAAAWAEAAGKSSNRTCGA